MSRHLLSLHNFAEGWPDSILKISLSDDLTILHNLKTYVQNTRN